MIRSDDNIYEMIEAWIRLALDDPKFLVIESNQSGVAPTGTYASIFITSSSSIGVGHKSKSLPIQEPVPDSVRIITTDGGRGAGLYLKGRNEGVMVDELSIVSGSLTADLPKTVGVTKWEYSDGVTDWTMKSGAGDTWRLNGAPVGTNNVTRYYDSTAIIQENPPRKQAWFIDGGEAPLPIVSYEPLFTSEDGAYFIDKENGRYYIFDAETSAYLFVSDTLLGEYEPVGSAVYSLTVEDGYKYVVNITTSNLREVSLSLNFFRSNAHENMNKIMNFPNTNKSYEFMFGNGASILIPDTYNNLDNLLPEQYVPRAQSDLRLQVSSEYVETVNVIDTVQVDVGINP